jgi:glycosyltransferase involved in cell wall biosynthesis
MIAGPYHLDIPRYRRLDRATYRLDHHILAGSRTVEERYARMGVAPARRSFTYYGPIADRFDPARAPRGALRRELGIDLDVPLVGQVAHFYPTVDGHWAPPAVRGKDVKGHDVFVRAAALVSDRHPETRFVFVGGPWGPLGEALMEETLALARELGIDDVLTLTGWRTDVPELLPDMDVAVQASRSENLGGTIEALLMEVPMVATAVGGMPEAVVDEETGLLVPTEDPEALAEAICRLLEDREWARSLASAGRQRMLAGYTANRMVDDIDMVIRSVGRRRGLSGAPVRAPA